MKKTALITGINGQDGSYLAELLLKKDYDVWGILKRNSVSENQTARIPDNIYKKLNYFNTLKFSHHNFLLLPVRENILNEMKMNT